MTLEREKQLPVDSFTPADGLVIPEHRIPHHVPSGKQDGSEANYFGYPNPMFEDEDGL